MELIALMKKEISDFIQDSGAVEAWKELGTFLRDSYDMTPEMIFDKKQGWDVRYRKSGKDSCNTPP